MTLKEQEKGSSYHSNFNSITNKKKIDKVESCKPKQQYSPNPNKLKYKTEYNGEYVKQEMANKKVI